MFDRITVRRRVASLVATAGIVVGGLGLLPRASATSTAKSQRFSGDDRYATAVDISKRAFPASSDNAVVASGEGFPDALAASYLAGQVGAPILLVKKAEVPSITATELTRLGVKTVWLIGGTSAISSDVETQLKAKYTVNRVFGADRYETAKVAATQQGSTVGTYKNDKTAIVASGENFPDALAGGAVAYGKKFPLLLTASQTLPPATSQALTSLAIKRVVLLGGETAVSPAVAAQIASTNGITVERIGGANRADTAAKVAELAVGALGFKDTEVVVASGSGFADALAGASYAGRNLFPILLMGSVPPETQAFVKAHNSTIGVITVLGGQAAVAQSDVDALTTTAKCSPATTTPTSAPGLTIITLPGGSTTTTAAGSTSSTLPPCSPTTTATTAGSSSVVPTTTGAGAGGPTTVFCVPNTQICF